jgi:selenocysteine lyase/cysteine desulfurase
MIFGNGNIPGLSQIAKVKIIGGLDNPAREGLVSIYVDDIPSIEIVEKLNNAGIRTHLRKADHYSGNILNPLKQESCIRVSLCHYNSIEEVNQFLIAIKEICD